MLHHHWSIQLFLQGILTLTISLMVAPFLARYTNLLADFYFTQHIVGASYVNDTSSTLIDHSL